MTRELRADGELASRNRIPRLMRENDLRAAGARHYRATTDSSHREPVAPNMLARDFVPNEPN